jgi:hypothetical protein
LEDVFQVTPVGVLPYKPLLDAGILVDEAGLERRKVGRCRGREILVQRLLEPERSTAIGGIVSAVIAGIGPPDGSVFLA